MVANIHPQQLDQLAKLLSEHHSGHRREYGAMEGCHEPTCVEAKLGLSYLSGRMEQQASGPDTFNLK